MDRRRFFRSSGKSFSRRREIKTNYDKGDTIQLLVGYFGSMDLYWSGDDSAVKNLSGASLVAVVKDGKGNICGENKVSLPDISDGNLKEEIVDVLLKARCSQISYDVSLTGRQSRFGQSFLQRINGKIRRQYVRLRRLRQVRLIGCFCFGFLFLSEKEKNIWIKNSPFSDYC